MAWGSVGPGGTSSVVGGTGGVGSTGIFADDRRDQSKPDDHRPECQHVEHGPPPGIYLVLRDAASGSSRTQLVDRPPWRVWKEKLRGFSSPTPIGSDESITRNSGYGYQHLSLNPATSTALRTLALENKLTLNTLFQGAWALLLSRYSGETDVVFGAAASGRSLPLPGIEAMIGLFISSLPVRVSIQPEKQLTAWLAERQEQQVQSLHYEDSSPKDIQNWSELDRYPRRSLFDTILSFNNYDFEESLREKATGRIVNPFMTASPQATVPATQAGTV